ncbi:unnamed protein product [Clonostachys rosea]|uniref:BZIP domain-containing protein n=1 Tax=Bionectria ochroleuca TaxID=29856 RepID=A0ABY6U873_BIOOC|nr:unnamed protein product [Clonostachys rosea]
MSPARRKAPSNRLRRDRQKKVHEYEKARRDITLLLSESWNGQGWIPADIRNCRRSPGSGTTDLTILRGIWRLTQTAVSKNISLHSLWQPGGILLESYNEYGVIWRKNINKAARDDSWCLGAPRLDGDQIAEIKNQTDSADFVTLSDEDEPEGLSDTEDPPMTNAISRRFPDTPAQISLDAASIGLWDFIDGSSVEQLDGQVGELEVEAGHATTRIARTKELSDNIRGKITALSDVQSGVRSILDNRLRNPETSKLDME